MSLVNQQVGYANSINIVYATTLVPIEEGSTSPLMY